MVVRRIVAVQNHRSSARAEMRSEWVSLLSKTAVVLGKLDLRATPRLRSLEFGVECEVEDGTEVGPELGGACWDHLRCGGT